MTFAEKLLKIAENEQLVADANVKLEGALYSGSEGGSGSMTGWYDTFWDDYQDNGNRSSYNYAFSHYGWTDKTYKPKYVVRPRYAQCIYCYSNIADTKIEVDFSIALTLESAFLGASSLKHIGTVDMRGLEQESRKIFHNCSQLHTIDKIMPPSGVYSKASLKDSFGGCTSLQNLIVEGDILDDIYLGDSPLTGESVVSVISALSPAVRGKTATFNKSVKDLFCTEDDPAGWVALIGGKDNWTISLV